MKTARFLPVVMMGLLFSLFNSTVVFAHPGHMAQDFVGGFLHPLTGVDHILALIAVGLWATQLGTRALFVLPLSFITFMVIGGLLLPAGLSLSFIESMIAASVLGVSLLVVTKARLPLVVGAVIVSIFAMAHGYAHIAESGSNQLWQYVAGFSATTAVLHTVGIGIGYWFSIQKKEKFTRLSGALTFAAGTVLLFI